jgi:hypothetical protein
MRKISKRASGSSTKTISRLDLFGPPPLLEGEDEAAYDETIARMSSAVGPTDFLEEIWVRDLADLTWNIMRLRRIQSAFLADRVWDDVNEEASSLAEADPELMEGTKEQKEEMNRLLDSDSELSWEARMAKYPRANEKFQKLWEAAKSTLDVDVIQAKIIVRELNTIERIEHLIMAARQRFDAVVREIDRHRIMQIQLSSVQVVEDANLKTINPKVGIRKITNQKVA